MLYVHTAFGFEVPVYTTPGQPTKSTINWPINPSKCGHVQYLQTTLTIKHVAKCMPSVTVVARPLCYRPLHFQFVNVNFRRFVINSLKGIISCKTLPNVNTWKAFSHFLTQQVVSFLCVLRMDLHSTRFDRGAETRNRVRIYTVLTTKCHTSPKYYFNKTEH